MADDSRAGHARRSGRRLLSGLLAAEVAGWCGKRDRRWLPFGVDFDFLPVATGDALWIVAALGFGLLARLVRVPPLVGFLLAGFALNALGASTTQFLEETADVGVTLLLFTIGLHLNVRVFTKLEVWGVAVAHVALFSIVVFVALLAGVALAVGPLADLEIAGAAALAVALAFSSTVFAAKVLEAQGAQRSRHGRIAMGVLIIQDIVAVVLLAVLDAEKRPTAWALLLLALPLLRRPLLWLMRRCGHGELLLLFAVITALGGAALFELVGLKGDLGALAFGLLLAGNIKSDELSGKIDNFKDLFLAGFFVSVGLTAPIELPSLLLGLSLLLLIPLKLAGFYGLFSAAKLRSRTALQASLELSSFSEFGLIVVATAVAAGIMPDDMLAVVAVAVAASLVIASPLAVNGDDIYVRWRAPLLKWQRKRRLPGDEDLHLEPVAVVVFGLGRLGTAALSSMEAEFPGRVLGVDVEPEVVEAKRAKGHHVVVGDATDPEFWARAKDLLTDLHWVLLAMSSHEANVATVESVRDSGYEGRIIATSRYADDAQELRAQGADTVFDVFSEAGAGFASELERRLRGFETGMMPAVDDIGTAYDEDLR